MGADSRVPAAMLVEVRLDPGRNIFCGEPPPWCLAKGLHEIGSRKEVLGEGKGSLSSRARLPGSRSTLTLLGRPPKYLVSKQKNQILLDFRVLVCCYFNMNRAMCFCHLVS